MEENTTYDYEVKKFDEDVIEKSRQVPVVVDFWAPWCGPCQMLGPILMKMAYEANGRWELVKVNVDEHQELAQQYGVQGIPFVLLFKDGDPIDGFTGALPQHMVEEWLEKYVPNELILEIEEARILIKSGEKEKAKQILEDILIDYPKNDDAKVALAEAVLFTNPDYARELVLKIFEGDELFDRADAVRTIADLLSLRNDTDSLEEDAVKPVFIEGINALSQQDFETALEKFIDVIIKNKHYNEEGARKGCVAIFRYLGEEHETTKKYRKRFDMALY